MSTPIQKMEKSYEALPIQEESPITQLEELAKYTYIYHCIAEGLPDNEPSQEETTLYLKESPKKQSLDIYEAYEEMLNNLETHESLFQLNSKILKSNTELQNYLTDMQGKLRYAAIPDNPTTGQLEDIQRLNQQIDADKAIYQSTIARVRQDASLAMAKLNTDAHWEERLVGEISNTLQNLNSANEAAAGIGKVRFR